ncbi:CPBP family intramembrane glutamic endopeptidase [Amycolatopsis sp. CA-230715]|uniref:CPBP family intramembrane glutamic endopeptidase n=1 Tax=Amycolatopsis sp. CA-230715 TaxID=2745196 RepID=UPI001C0384EA|nr:CPBP family intramembrane glutamic endopeptidase [Amycolatopsis sp. CA-230715]QWF85718.1 hypothetical protein HUW46_09198 [Amycolatopsis sp. CA-230715]
MAAPGIDGRLRDAGWCLAVALVVAAAYLGLGVAVVSIVGEPILGTIVADLLVVVLVGVVRRARPEWITYAPRSRPAGDTPVWAWTAAGCAVLAFLAGQSVALWLYGAVGSTGFDTSVRAREHAGATAALVLTLVAAPVAEEILFRGLLYPLARTRVGVGAAVLFTAGVFGILHGNIVQFASALPIAVVLTLVYERTRHLWPCVVVHLGFNLAAIVVPAPVLAGLSNPVSALLLTAVLAGGALPLMWKISSTPTLEASIVEPRRGKAERTTETQES